MLNFKKENGLGIKKEENKYGFLTTPKVFADYRHFIKDEKGNQIIDIDYNYKSEIQKQLELLDNNQKQIKK